MVDAAHYHHHHHHHHGGNGGGGGGINSHGNNAATALGVGVGVSVIPLLTAGSCLNMTSGAATGTDGGGFDTHEAFMSRTRANAMQLWQTQQQQIGGGGNYPKKSINFDPDGQNLLGPSSTTTSALGCGVVGGATTCQDCGNQAKKDCSHRRCRTCCRSRGFDCSTHVKSTWVPAARRRERQMMGPAGTHITGGATATATGGGGASSGSTSGAKKPRLISSQTTSHTSTSNTPPRSFDTSSSHQDASFKESLPGQVKAPAVFKCVRVTAVEDGDDEFAYQAVVKIGGHVFKGFLYDQGVEPRDGFPNLSELHLGSSSGGGGGGGRNNNGGAASSSSPLLDPSDVYGATGGGGGGGGGLFGGSSYGRPKVTAHFTGVSVLFLVLRSPMWMISHTNFRTKNACSSNSIPSSFDQAMSAFINFGVERY